MTYKDFVLLNGRIEAGKDSAGFLTPHGKVFIITDITVQNRMPGDGPVYPTHFSRLFMGQVSGYNCNTGSPPNVQSGFDICYTVVGNETLNIHYQTGLVATSGFRLNNAGNSSATFVEFTICGYLVNK